MPRVKRVTAAVIASAAVAISGALLTAAPAFADGVSCTVTDPNASASPDANVSRTGSGSTTVSADPNVNTSGGTVTCTPPLP